MTLIRSIKVTISNDLNNGNRKLLKKRYETKIEPVAALLDAFVAWKLNKEAFE